MADNVTVDNGGLTDYTVSSDEGAGGHVQRVKLAYSADGSETHVPADADGLLVNLGANNDVTVTDVVPGTGATKLGKAIDAAAGASDTGVAVLLVRDDALATLTPADGDYTHGRTNARGAMWVALDSTAAQTVTLAAGTATNEAVGDVAEDAALAGNPLRQGVRAHSGVPTAMSADNDIVTPWADRSGAQVVIPQPRQVDIQGVSNLGTSTDYTSGDYMGSVITFTSVALASGRPIQIVGANLLDRAIQSIALTLLLFRASPTVASADNAALSITAANASTARFLGAVKFEAANYVGATSCSFCSGTLVNGPIPIVTSGSGNIFGVLVAGGTYNAAAAGDLEINLVCNQF